MILTTPTLSGTVIDTLTANEVVQTNSSNQLIASNTLPSSRVIPTPTISNSTLSGTTSTPLTVNEVVQTNSSNQLIASDTINNLNMTGSATVNGNLQCFEANGTTNLFHVNQSTGAVNTLANTLDDGAGDTYLKTVAVANLVSSQLVYTGTNVLGYGGSKHCVMREVTRGFFCHHSPPTTTNFWYETM